MPIARLSSGQDQTHAGPPRLALQSHDASTMVQIFLVIEEYACGRRS